MYGTFRTWIADTSAVLSPPFGTNVIRSVPSLHGKYGTVMSIALYRAPDHEYGSTL